MGEKDTRLMRVIETREHYRAGPQRPATYLARRLPLWQTQHRWLTIRLIKDSRGLSRRSVSFYAEGGFHRDRISLFRRHGLSDVFEI